ncbi:MAG: hypothetical protein AAGB32_03005 [Pseudomonadota bacterium]
MKILLLTILSLIIFSLPAKANENTNLNNLELYDSTDIVNINYTPVTDNPVIYNNRIYKDNSFRREDEWEMYLTNKYNRNDDVSSGLFFVGFETVITD